MKYNDFEVTFIVMKAFESNLVKTTEIMNVHTLL